MAASSGLTENLKQPDGLNTDTSTQEKAASSGAVPETGPPDGDPGEGDSAVFPSLSDTVLRQLGALMDEVRTKDAAKDRNQSYEKDIENKFTTLMLAFKTDTLTLDRRREVQSHQRDQAEKNMSAELTRLKAAVELLSPLCTDSEKFELLEKVSEQVDALHKSTVTVSTSAEMHGAVQQEYRLSKAVDIILRHVENLKQAYEKEKTELEETRKILTDNKISPSAAASKLQNTKRRASIATVSRVLSSLEPTRSPARENRSASRARLSSLPRKLSNTILEADSEEPPPTKDPPNSNGGSGSPSSDSVSSATNTLPSRSSPRTTDERGTTRHSEGPESEDEASPEQPFIGIAPSTPSDPLFTIHSRRLSIQSAWLTKLSQSWERFGPMDEVLTHLRMGVAGVLLVAALAVLAHCCLMPYIYLWS